jgi:PAS domain S-box-containing protein
VESFLDEVKRFTRFGKADEAELSAFHALVQPHFAAIADSFYERLAEHRDAVKVFSGPEQIKRLKGSLSNWLDTLLAGPWDTSYFQRRSRIGRAHVRVQLPQRYMLTAMNLIRLALTDIAAAAYERDRFLRVERAIGKILDIELAIMLETYRGDYVDRVQRHERLEKVVLEQRLAESEARYMAIVENAAALVVATDAHHHILLFNQTAERLSGYDRTEVLGRPVLELLCHPDDAPAAAETLSRGEAFDARLIGQNRQEHWIRWHSTRLTANGEPATCLIGIDSTQERRLAGRTRRAEQLASLGTLAAGLAHEIRNPLNAAHLQLMLVERRLRKNSADDRKGALEAARVVRDELERLAGLVQDFLSFARPNELRVAPADLRETALGIIALLDPPAAEAGVTLAAAEPLPSLTVRCDEERIKQVLINLVRNAIEAAGAGGDVTLRLGRDRDWAEIEVSDSGPGIPGDINIFEPFSTSKEKGTGLGLPIVHRIVTDHGGDIFVSRRVRRTIFAVHLPISGP